jgi:outer membrane receptor protein involved in Fe transport
MQNILHSEFSRGRYRFVPAAGSRAALAAVLAVSLLSPVASATDVDIDSGTGEVAGPAPVSAEVLEPIHVVGRRLNLVGEAISASEGRVGPTEIAARPLARSGDLLEFVPGLVATQHSGSGKANQYFLRGFNLDHGTDFATSVDAMPVNMRTHGHGQGWTDLNFLIPETVEELSYRKGTYYADVGDFSSTGAARFELADRVARGSAEASLGEYGYQRGVFLHSAALGAGDLLYAAELQTFDGPWTDIDEDVEKVNLMLRYSADLGAGRAHAMWMGYDNSWSSPDQIPQHAVDAGLISEFGAVDTTVGGAASRYSLSAGWRGMAFGGEFQGDVYAIDSELDLYSNFTYLLDDPEHGDQFEQVDDRRLYGLVLSQQWQGERSRWRVGLEGRYDDIAEVGLYRTQARVRHATVRQDAVQERSAGIFLANEFRISEQLRSYLGLRHDDYDFDVDARSLAANSGNASDSATSLKAGLVYRPADPLELYASFGQGFHSNDARGTTIRFDPVSGEAVDAVDPLVASDGAELGARVFFNDRLQASLAAWSLRLDSELLFVGDAGNTEPSRPSAREGLELGMYWFGSDRLSAELEASYTRARFRDADAAGREIPGAIPLVIGAGVSLRTDSGWMANAHLRHFGAYPLIEDGSVESEGSTLVNLRVGREWPQWAVYLDALNAFDSRDHDVDYFYASRLSGEPAEGIDDIHFHIFQPRSLRLSLRLMF